MCASSLHHRPVPFLRLLLLACLCSDSAFAGIRAAPFPADPPLNQLEIFANSCGPVCLYNSLLYASPRWRRLIDRLEGDTPRDQVKWLVRAYGAQPSRHFPGQRRWRAKDGMRNHDLLDAANDMRMGMMPRLELTSHFQAPDVANTDLLAQVHREMRHSLQKGYPPIATLRRFVRRGSIWQRHQGHFVSIVEVPAQLPRGAKSFTVTYLDPWGGKKLTATLRAPESTYPVKPKGGALFDLKTGPAAIIADFPQTRVGLHLVKDGQQTRLILDSLISVK